MQVNEQGLKNKEQWESKGYDLPKFDRAAVTEKTKENPFWVHFGAGNIFRAFQANVVQNLLNDGVLDRGLVVAEGFDYEIVEKMNRPHDGYSILVTLKANGSVEKTVVGSVVESLTVDSDNDADFNRLREIFKKDSLQMASFTITEKGYSLVNGKGEMLPSVVADMEKGPEKPESYIGKVVSLLYTRFQAGEKPIAMVSMDNCARNGEKLRAGVLSMARGWAERGLVESAFLDWLEDEGRVSFPWSMIDKITPHPSERVQEELGRLGVADMAIARTNTGTLIAPFVNAEITEYLVLEDAFPNGRPALEGAGVYLTDRTTVEKAEKMKVGTCLNPLHTALAVYGCLLGYTSIAAEMGDADLKALVEHIAAESLPVVEDPGILSPRAFIDEVLHERFPNPAIPDTPQRIAADTSQKLPVRYGGTLRRYSRQSEQALAGLEFAPLVFAGWCRYLLGVDDRGNAMPVSPDPMLPQLQAHLKGIEVGRPDSLAGQLRPILSNAALFGVDLYAAGLGERTEEMFRDMLAGPGAVRATLHRNCVCKQP